MAKAKGNEVQGVLDKYTGVAKTKVIPTDSISLDRLFGGGLPLGKYVQLYSPQGIGKTTVSVWIAIALAERGMKTLFIDVENALEDSLVIGCGGEKYLKNGMIQIIRQATTYKALEEVFGAVLAAREHTLIVLDSITAVTPQTLLDISVEEMRPGLKSILEGNFLQKYKAAVRDAGCTVLLLNQMRTKINFKRGSSQGAAGSNALHFFSDITISMRRAKAIIEDERQIGTSVLAKAEKNKCVAPFIEYPLHIIFGQGISDVRTFVSIMDQNNLIEQAGAYYKPTFAPKGTKNLLGNDRLLDWVRENRAFVEEYLRENGYI